MVYLRKAFSFKKTEMQKLNEISPAADEKIYAMDVNASGAKTFFAKTLPAMWELQANRTPRNFCEVIADSPCHMFFDLDEGDVRAQWRKLEKMLNQVFSTLKDQVGVVRYYFLDASKTIDNRVLVVATLITKRETNAAIADNHTRRSMAHDFR